MDPDQNQAVFSTWFLGNMFMDRYFVMHDMENAVKDQDLKPRIGIYDKWLPRTSPVQDPSIFSTGAGHCTDKDNLRRKGTDWKDLGKGESEKDCRHKCSLDDDCSAYEYSGNEMQCAHWFGEILADGSAGTSCYIKERPIIEPEPE